MSRKRSIENEVDTPSNKIPKIKPKLNPPLLSNTSNNIINNRNHLLSLWKTARYKFRGDQRFPRYTGFVIKHTQVDRTKTIMTYLPPIEKPITDYGTLFEILRRAERLAKEANMKYVHIVMDCGTAMKMFHVIWNNPTEYSKVFIHLAGEPSWRTILHEKCENCWRNKIFSNTQVHRVEMGSESFATDGIR